MGNEEPKLSWKKEYWRRSSERHQKKLNGPKNMAQHTEAKQNWVNRESKRIEAESAKLARDAGEFQSSERNSESSLRGGQDTPRSPACERSNRLDKNRRHIMTLESTEETRNLDKENYREKTGWMDERQIDGGDC